jgi:mannose-6-phosphate isomerase-like protein (cupin superfamily)
MRLSGDESDQCCDDIFIVVEGESQTVRGGWPVTVAVAQMQCFGFGSRWEATG